MYVVDLLFGRGCYTFLDSKFKWGLSGDFYFERYSITTFAMVTEVMVMHFYGVKCILMRSCPIIRNVLCLTESSLLALHVLVLHLLYFVFLFWKIHMCWSLGSYAFSSPNLFCVSAVYVVLSVK